jgi:hypothetical protein
MRIDKSKVYEILGLLIARHYEVCTQKMNEALLRKREAQFDYDIDNIGDTI